MSAPAIDLFEQANSHRRELLGYCYRYLGSAAEAEDAVQETLTRAWRRSEQFRGQSMLRTWLYSIAVHVCADMTRAPQRRALPMDLQQASTVGDGRPDLGSPLPAETWARPTTSTARSGCSPTTPPSRCRR